MRTVKWRLQVVVCALVAVFVLCPSATRAQEENYDDPFYRQKGTAQLTNTFYQVAESVDPFTGNLNLTHTDLVLPGDGGLDLSIMGIGWSFHFGRVRNPHGTGSSNRFNPDNPVVEMPDGSVHPLYRDRNDTTRFISREYWPYRLASGTGTTFELTLTDGTVYRFPASTGYFTGDGVQVYQVGSITTTNGNAITFTYDPSNPRKLTSITDSTGRSITFAYTTFPNIFSGSDTVVTSMTANNRVYRYHYTTIDNKLFLTEAEPPVGPSWTYSYYPNSNALQRYLLETITYPTGAELTYQYGDVDFDVGPTVVTFRVVTRRSLSGRGLTSTSWTYAYAGNSGSSQVTTVTQSGCRTKRYTYASFRGLPNTGLSNNLWRLGLLLERQVRSGTTVVQSETLTWAAGPSISTDDLPNGNWNGTGGQLYDNEIIAPRLTTRVITRDGGTYTTSYSGYDAFGNPGTIGESGELARTTTLTYHVDTSKNIVHGRPTSEAVTVGSETFTTTSAYDPNGNLTSRSRYGVTTEYGYTNGNLTSRTNARNVTISFQYTRGVVSRITNPFYFVQRSINWSGTVASETNGRGHTTSFGYDALDRLTSINPPLEATTSITYNNTGATNWRVTKGVTFTQSNVDGLGRVASTAASEGINTRRTYNACGQVSYESYPHTTTNIGDSFTYDALDRVTRVVHPDATDVDYTYGSGSVSVTDERNVTRTYGYSAFGDPDERLLVSVADATGTTSYLYNTVGSLRRVTHPGGLTREFSYNTKNFLTEETHPETGTITYGRDAVGNMTSRADGRGTTAFTYDSLDRLTDINYPATTPDVAFAYDDADNRTLVSSVAAVVRYNFDAENRLVEQAATIDGRIYVTSYGYDTRGNLTDVTYPTTRVVGYGYDAANRVTSIGGFVSSVAYHPSGAIASMTYTNGKTTTLAYDNRYRLTSINTPGVRVHTLGYDGVGNVTSITDGLDSARNRSMGYDNADRLTSASGIWGSMSFAYSPVGNRTSKTVNGVGTTYTYSSTNNRLLSASGGEPDTYSYDASGNIVSLGGRILTYDAANRLDTVDGGAFTYAYDGDGRRVRKQVQASGAVTLYHVDPQGRILVETDGAGTPGTEYVYLGSLHVAKVERAPIGPETVLFYHNDAVGSPVAMTDASGAVVWRADYEPFGGVVAESGTATTSHRFTGKERDAETGLDHFGARYYDARLGRFLSIDPVLEVSTAFAAPQRWNRFTYALNSPFRYGDPDGRDAVVLHGGFIGDRTGVTRLSDTVRGFSPPRDPASIRTATGPGRYGGPLGDHPEAGTLFAENHVHENGPRILAGWSLGGDAALAAGPPHGGGAWDLRVVVGATVDRNIVRRIDKAARTSHMVVIVALRGDTFGGDRSYESLVSTLRGAFRSLDGFYEYYPNVQVEPSDASHYTGGGNHASTQEAIRRGVKTVSERILRQQRAH